MSNLSEINEIFDRCIKGTATQSERNMFYDWIELPENKAEAVKLWETAFAKSDGSLNMGDRNREAMIEAILNANSDNLPVAPHRVHFLKTAWFRYAAILLLLAGTATYLYKTASFRMNPGVLAHHGDANPQDIPPGANKAVLTVGDNNIQLSASKTGIAIGNIITYNDGEKIADASQRLQLTTPRGGQYQLTLPDGTKAWLNAESGIKFPSRFDGIERKVEITGEVYMEVAEDRTRPFVVAVNDIEVQVLGTSFNMNAYNDEPFVKATLLQGSIKILKQGQGILLKPGQQAVIRDKIVLNKEVDVEQAVAWKNGVFNFNGATLDEFMRQLSRWYDLKIVYKGEIPRRTFKGEMGRDLELSQIMEMLDLFKIKYKREGRTVSIDQQ